eukprot:8518842-Ditylum_brightwellii.AAC.1
MLEVHASKHTLGDHPCVSSGAPVTLGWKYNQYGSMSVDEYKRAQGSLWQWEQLRIPHEKRVQILLCNIKALLRDVKNAELSAPR